MRSKWQEVGTDKVAIVVFLDLCLLGHEWSPNLVLLSLLPVELLLIRSIGQVTFCVQVISNRLFSGPPVDSFSVPRIHRNPVQPLRNALSNDRHSASIHVIQPNKAFAHPIDFVRVSPVGLIDDKAVAVNQIEHVGQEAVGSMRGSLKI